MLLWLPVLAFLTADAQNSPINFTSLSSKDGLLSNSVNAILKDRYGLMWFATDDGLNKYDGANFTVYRYRPGDSTSLRVNEILALHEDRNGNLWIGTSGGGLSLYDRQKDLFHHYPRQGAVDGPGRNAVIRSLCSDYEGKIWIAQFDNLYNMDPNTKQFTRYALPENQSATVNRSLISVFEDSRQRLWVATDNGLYLYTRQTNQFKQFIHDDADPGSIAGDVVRTVAEDKQGDIWVGTINGLSKYQANGRFVNYRFNPADANTLGNNDINCIVPDAEGLLWIGTGNGLTIFNTHTQQFTVLQPEYGNIHSLTSRWIKCAFIDQQGIYWFGTFRGGINKYDKNVNLFDLKLSTSFQDKKKGAPISAMVEHKTGHVLLGTDGNGLYEFNRIKNTVHPFQLPIANAASVLQSVPALYRTRSNKLFIGTYGYGLLIVDQTTGAIKHLRQGKTLNDLSSNDIFCIAEDKKGHIWIGTNGGGINVLHNDRVIAKFTPKPCGLGETLLPLNGYIRAIREDADGNIWIGTHGGGIAIYKPGNGSWTVYTQTNSQLPSDKIQVIHAGRDGTMWIGTFGGGLATYDKTQQRFRSFTEKDGLQNTMVYHIMEDHAGNLWLSTNTGISSYDIKTKKFRNFTSYNGVQNSNFVHASGMRSADGMLFFGGLLGFNYFNPGKLTVNRNVPAVILTDLKISNKSVNAGEQSPIKDHISVAKEIRLDYKQNFALNFVALNYTIPKQNHYAYKLDGFDKDWNYTGSATTASYTNLDPGEYIFRVKASNNDGVWSSKDTTIKIYVRPPFWRTTWAYIFYVVAIGGLLLYSRYRGIRKLRQKFELEQERQHVKRMQELDRLKLKFLTNLSHDFRTPISLIMGPVEQLIETEDKAANIEKLHMVRRNARRLLNLVNQLLDFRKMEEHELKLHLAPGEFISFLREVTESFRDLSERKNIQFVFTSCIDRLDTLFDRDKIERILFNLLSNAFKFTLGGGLIIVDLQKAERSAEDDCTWVTIKVADTGIGIPEDKKDLIFDRFFQSETNTSVVNQGTGIGLAITREFVKLHGGSIDVESEPGKGCTFTIQLPLQRAEVAVPEPAPAAKKVAEEPVAVTHDAPYRLSVLLVEDNEDFRFYLKDNLRAHYRVIEAANGKEGWQKALSHHPHLIVSDISMPEMDGIALVKKLKADKRTGHIPVIMLTAMNGQEQQIKGLETGACDYITKPFNFEVLNAKIKNLLELKSTMQNIYVKQIKVADPEIKIESVEEKLVKDIAHYLEQNIANPQLSVEAMSKHLGMSRGTLYGKMLQITGQTPVEYIRSFRLKRAAMLMEKSKMTISEIAYQVGFTAPNYFARSFKSQFHMSPSEFIARVRKENPNNDN
jgi:Signal transduction histidine kinase